MSREREAGDEARWRHDGLDENNLRMVDVAGLRTRVYEAGSGETVLLIHGGQFGSLYSLDAWSLNLPDLARRFRVVAFDKVGQGYTDAPAADDGYIFDTVVDHALAVLDEVAGEPVHIVGHSRGGAVAARIALARPASVRSLVMVDTGSTAPLDPAVPIGAFYAPLEGADLWDAPDRRTVVAEPEAQAARRDWITDDFVERMRRIALLPTMAATRRTLAAVETTHWRPSLAATRAATLRALDEDGFPVPTLLMWGYEDRSAPRHLGLRLFERIAARTADCAFVMANGAGHYLFRDRPTWFSATLRSFCLDREVAA
jgi:2-hydroxy-6-oxonona-2,4-dienedioate hydrolase